MVPAALNSSVIDRQHAYRRSTLATLSRYPSSPFDEEYPTEKEAEVEEPGDMSLDLVTFWAAWAQCETDR